MNNNFRWCLCVVLLGLCSCNLNGKSYVPYLIDGEMKIDSSSEYEIGGLDFYFLNKSEKAVESFTLVFFLFDSEGNPPAMGRNNIVLTVNTTIAPEKSLSGCVSMDAYLYEIPEEPYDVDCLYVSKIVYEDGSVWSDPFGLCAFK